MGGDAAVAVRTADFSVEACLEGRALRVSELAARPRSATKRLAAAAFLLHEAVALRETVLAHVPHLP